MKLLKLSSAGLIGLTAVVVAAPDTHDGFDNDLPAGMIYKNDASVKCVLKQRSSFAKLTHLDTIVMAASIFSAVMPKTPVPSLASACLVASMISLTLAASPSLQSLRRSARLLSRQTLDYTTVICMSLHHRFVTKGLLSRVENAPDPTTRSR